jgi:hypothetical protein
MAVAAPRIWVDGRDHTNAAEFWSIDGNLAGSLQTTYNSPRVRRVRNTRHYDRER